MLTLIGGVATSHRKRTAPQKHDASSVWAIAAMAASMITPLAQSLVITDGATGSTQHT